MSPPGLLADPEVCGSATPTKNELIEVGRAWLDHFHVKFGNSRLFSLAIQFKAKCPNAGRILFIEYLCARVEVSYERQQALLASDPDFYRPYAHRDRYGELAVNNVMRSRGF